MENKIEMYIQLLSNKIIDRQKQVIALPDNAVIPKAVLRGSILGLENALNSFKILNER